MRSRQARASALHTADPGPVCLANTKCCALPPVFGSNLTRLVHNGLCDRIADCCFVNFGRARFGNSQKMSQAGMDLCLSSRSLPRHAERRRAPLLYPDSHRMRSQHSEDARRDLSPSTQPRPRCSSRGTARCSLRLGRFIDHAPKCRFCLIMRERDSDE
jgi:hypothetical protein